MNAEFPNVCKNCNGCGYVTKLFSNDIKDCRRCGGTGFDPEERKPERCPNCKGTGNITVWVRSE
jgi:DnaJ-class molecular chaperone